MSSSISKILRTSSKKDGQRKSPGSLTDTYFEEIGFKFGDNSFVGSTESPDLDGDDMIFYNDMSMYESDDSMDIHSTLMSPVQSQPNDESPFRDLQNLVSQKHKSRKQGDEDSLNYSPSNHKTSKTNYLDGVVEEEEENYEFEDGESDIIHTPVEDETFWTDIKDGVVEEEEEDGEELDEGELNVIYTPEGFYNLSIDKKMKKSREFGDLRISRTRSTLERESFEEEEIIDFEKDPDAQGDLSVQTEKSMSIRSYERQIRKWAIIKFLSCLGIFFIISSFLLLGVGLFTSTNGTGGRSSANIRGGEKLRPLSHGWEIEEPLALTAAPMLPPTISPTMKPSVCDSSLVPDKACYITASDDISITFKNCNAEQYDWIGFFPIHLFMGAGFFGEKEVELKMKKADFWVRTCGSLKCENVVHSDTLIFPHTAELNSGEYMIFLVNSENPDDNINGGKILVHHDCQ